MSILFHYCGWNVTWTCFRNTYPTGSPVWFCSFPLWLMAIGTSSSTDVWHHNGSAGNTRPLINMRHGPGDRALWEKRRRGERCRLVGSCVSVCECMWCFWLPSVSWISYKGLLWFLFSSFCLCVTSHKLVSWSDHIKNMFILFVRNQVLVSQHEGHLDEISYLKRTSQVNLGIQYL